MELIWTSFWYVLFSYNVLLFQDNKKASSLPNILDCGAESDGNGTLKARTGTGTGGPKSRRSMAPTIELPRLRLPKLSRSTGKGVFFFLPISSSFYFYPMQRR